MKYSQLKEVFTASEIAVISTKWNITFSNSSRTVKMYWGDKLKASSKSWTGIVGSGDFPVIKNDGEIIEISPYKDEGFIKLKLSSGEEVTITCLFMDGKNSSTEELIWSTTTMSEEDVKWLGDNHAATKIAVECGHTLKMLGMYKESGLKTLRIFESEILGRQENQFEIIHFSPKEIPLKGIKGDINFYRYKNSIEISVFNGAESVSYRTEILIQESEQTFPDYYCSSGVDLKPPKQLGQQLKDMVKDLLEANKRETPIPVSLKDGVLHINKNVVIECPIKSATGAVSCTAKAVKALINDFMPGKLNCPISILFPSEPNGTHPETGKVIPDHLVIIYGQESRNRFLIYCSIKTPFFYESNITEGNKKREAQKAQEAVEKTTTKVVAQLDAIANATKDMGDIPFIPDLTPEKIQEKKKEIEAIADKAIRPLKRSGDELSTNRIKKWVVQAYDDAGRILEMSYDVEKAAASWSILYEEDLLGLPAEKDTY